MRFIFDGAYAEFRGYVFANRQPVNVTDRGTIEALKRNAQFRKVEDGPQENKAPAAPVLKRQTLSLGKRK